jgi:hypothetical protein
VNHVCRRCGRSIAPIRLSPEAARWRGKPTIWVDLYGLDRQTGPILGHYHEPEGVGSRG